ncbi:MAG: hypothetical protein NVS4B6_30480 [Mycobacterium sp.]
MAPGGTVTGPPKLMFAMVSVAAPAAAGPLVASLPVAVAVDVPDWVPELELLDPAQAAVIATRHTAAKNRPNLFIRDPS